MITHKKGTDVAARIAKIFDRLHLKMLSPKQILQRLPIAPE